jgi:hypothetical protein
MDAFELGGILKARFEKDAVLHLVDERPEPDDSSPRVGADR